VTLALAIVLLWLGAAALWWSIHSGGEQGKTPLWDVYKSVLGRSVPTG
jgi:hypothetical protein